MNSYQIEPIFTKVVSDLLSNYDILLARSNDVASIFESLKRDKVHEPEVLTDTINKQVVELLIILSNAIPSHIREFLVNSYFSDKLVIDNEDKRTRLGNVLIIPVPKDKTLQTVVLALAMRVYLQSKGSKLNSQDPVITLKRTIQSFVNNFTQEVDKRIEYDREADAKKIDELLDLLSASNLTSTQLIDKINELDIGNKYLVFHILDSYIKRLESCEIQHSSIINLAPQTVPDPGNVYSKSNEFRSTPLNHVGWVTELSCTGFPVINKPYPQSTFPIAVDLLAEFKPLRSIMIGCVALGQTILRTTIEVADRSYVRSSFDKSKVEFVSLSDEMNKMVTSANQIVSINAAPVTSWRDLLTHVYGNSEWHHKPTTLKSLTASTHSNEKLVDHIVSEDDFKHAKLNEISESMKDLLAIRVIKDKITLIDDLIKAIGTIKTQATDKPAETSPSGEKDSKIKKSDSGDKS